MNPMYTEADETYEATYLAQEQARESRSVARLQTTKLAHDAANFRVYDLKRTELRNQAIRVLISAGHDKIEADEIWNKSLEGVEGQQKLQIHSSDF